MGLLLKFSQHLNLHVGAGHGAKPLLKDGEHVPHGGREGLGVQNAQGAAALGVRRSHRQQEGERGAHLGDLGDSRQAEATRCSDGSFRHKASSACII